MDYEANSLPLSYLTGWWMGIKEACTKYVVYKSIRCTQLSQTDELWTLSNKMQCKNGRNINVSFHIMSFWTKCAKNVKIVGKWLEILWRQVRPINWKSTKLIVSINSHIHFEFQNDSSFNGYLSYLNVIDWTSRPLACLQFFFRFRYVSLNF